MSFNLILKMAQSRQTIPCVTIRTMSYLMFLSLFAGKDIGVLTQLSIQVNCFYPLAELI